MPGLTTSVPVPDAREVARICVIPDRVIRNLEITDCYARLSDALRRRLGDGANWCSFATWASRQAGATIRGEDLLDRLKRRLGRAARFFAPVRALQRALLRRGLFQPETALGRAVAAIHTPYDSFERASEAVAVGNLKVFSEIGHHFASYLETVPEGADPASPPLQVFLAGLRPGEPPEGQDCLKAAFSHYTTAAVERDPAARAALLLLANLQIGLHEQTRLQADIAAALRAPAVTAVDLGRRALHAFVPGSRRWPRLLEQPAAAVLGGLAKPIRAAGERLTREIITESMMVLSLPGLVLALGRDLDAPVPPVLFEARHAELAALTARFDPCGPGGTACGATDWADLHERMHYITHLFRAYACEPSLFDPPFTPDQVRQFRAGVVPGGTL